MKIVPTFKNLYQVLALAPQEFNLVAHIRDHSIQTNNLSASCRQLAKEGADFALDLQLCDRIFSAVLRTVRLAFFAVLPQRVSQSVTPVSLVLQIIAQLDDCAIHLVKVEIVSRTIWRRSFLLRHILWWTLTVVNAPWWSVS